MEKQFIDCVVFDCENALRFQDTVREFFATHCIGSVVKWEITPLETTWNFSALFWNEEEQDEVSEVVEALEGGETNFGGLESDEWD